METLKFYDLNPGDRFVCRDDAVCTKLNAAQARMHSLEAKRLSGVPVISIAAFPPNEQVRFIPVVPETFTHEVS